MIKKKSRPPHFGECPNPMSFQSAYDYILNNPNKKYLTTGNSTPFVAFSTISIKGEHKGDKVIRFFTKGTEKGRSYPCCWGCITNCNKTYIDCFTKAITK
jgi:hypothetical protein